MLTFRITDMTTMHRRQRNVPITIEHDDQWLWARMIELAVEVGLLAAAVVVVFSAFMFFAA